jgi:hypothetical protein
MEGLEKIGFEVGWDHAEYGLSLPADFSGPGVMLDGYKAGILRLGQARPKEHDIFTKKWLQLRRSAWRRGRIFEEAVTPRFLVQIAQDNCPICRFEMTSGTGEDTDWSVDRLNNDGGYARGNLVVMSVRANKAKAALTVEEIVKRSTEFSEEHQAMVLDSTPLYGLTVQETMRLYTLTVLTSVEHMVIPSVVMVPPHVPTGVPYILQCYLARLSVIAVFSAKLMRELKALDGRPNGIWRVVRLMMERAKPRIADHPNSASWFDWGAREYVIGGQDVDWLAEDIWLYNADVYKAFHKWALNAPPKVFEYVTRSVFDLAARQGCGTSFNRTTNVDREALGHRIGLDTRGFVDAHDRRASPRPDSEDRRAPIEMPPGTDIIPVQPTEGVSTA